MTDINQTFDAERLVREAYAIAERMEPVGLDLGAVTNSEIAFAILAEIPNSLNGRSGCSLSRREMQGDDQWPTIGLQSVS